MVNTNRIPFLNTYVDNLTASEAKSCVDQLIQEPGYHYVVTPNSDIVVKMQDDPKLKKICENADLILTDGQIVVKISRKSKYPIKERVCMTDFVWDVMDLANEKEYKVFLFGGKEDVLAKATKRIKKKYPGLNIVDSYSPPFGFEKNKEQLKEANERIRKSGADILIVFLGCPKQEKFIAKNKDKYQIPISITMGGCVDFKKRIAHSHNTKCDQVRADKLLRPLFYHLYTDALACGDDAGKWLYRGRTFTVLKNGREVGKYKFNPVIRERMRKQYGLKNELIIGHVGNFVEQKNHKFLVSVFRELIRKCFDVKLILIGEGVLRGEMKKSCFFYWEYGTRGGLSSNDGCNDASVII